ncbi:hypothetical protein Pmar_PMAR001993 [Perkinsus marinus ATCC 50983]|uniref:Uncharacterized protein n=1 Tax=Perkinsus marinus (strain ATCC 50983 / TXsc) TaxID=423536 RepID=C5LYD8_PERM5|nr:hypothetical protein Pmar_PMAR001993 [Perkinsus marinus ATCC 50983]EEQ98176.1 hypothetical protein Pmar_PMAR001993 [Perkinsus marinus ATCC 50983]|eukprot:XP_002765459.1 hypothetical protein Pmar_PMAR001993 [Perkinsus marinus ATCC 50983]
MQGFGTIRPRAVVRLQDALVSNMGARALEGRAEEGRREQSRRTAPTVSTTVFGSYNLAALEESRLEATRAHSRHVRLGRVHGTYVNLHAPGRLDSTIEANLPKASQILAGNVRIMEGEAGSDRDRTTQSIPTVKPPIDLAFKIGAPILPSVTLNRVVAPVLVLTYPNTR